MLCIIAWIASSQIPVHRKRFNLIASKDSIVFRTCPSLSKPDLEIFSFRRQSKLKLRKDGWFLKPWQMLINPSSVNTLYKPTASKLRLIVFKQAKPFKAWPKSYIPVSVTFSQNITCKFCKRLILLKENPRFFIPISSILAQLVKSSLMLLKEGSLFKAWVPIN